MAARSLYSRAFFSNPAHQTTSPSAIRHLPPPSPSSLPMSSSFEDTRAPIFAPRHFFDIMVPYSEQPLSLHQHPHDIEFDSYSLPPPLERPDLLDDMMLATSEESAAMSELLADNSLLQTSPFRDEMLFGRFAESNPDGCSSSSSSLLSSKSDADFYHHRDAADYMFEHALRAADRNVPEHDEQLHNDDWAADLYATYSACSNIEELETAVATCCAASPSSSSSSSSSASWSSAATAVPLTRSHSNPRTTLASASDSKAPDENRAEQHRTLCAAIDCSHHADAESMLCTTHREHFREFVCGAQAANCTIVYTPISPVPNFEQDIVRRIFLSLSLSLVEQAANMRIDALLLCTGLCQLHRERHAQLQQAKALDTWPAESRVPEAMHHVFAQHQHQDGPDAAQAAHVARDRGT